MNNEQTPSLEQALQHVDERRRGFLTKLLAGTAAVAAVPMMTSIAFAQQDGEGSQGKGKGGKGKGGQGKGGDRRSTQPTPAELAKTLIKNHDKDGDQKLSLTELTAALTAMQAARRGGGAAGGGKGKGAGGGKGKGAGGGKGKGTQ